MDKKQLKIPTYLLVIIAILIICIIFIFAVQIPFAQKVSGYDKDHESAAKQISKYNDYLNRASEVSSKNDEMKKEYEANSRKLFTNAKMSPDDIRTSLERYNTVIKHLSINEGVADPAGKAAVGGEPLYSTAVNYRFIGTIDKVKATLDFLEYMTDGGYFVHSIKVAVPKTTTATESVVTSSSNNTYEVTLTMNLYYFNNTVAPIVRSSSSSESSK